ncbi:MAG: hypothetical protein ACTSWY_00405 [Promethearchaeota archaeon]
MKKLTKAFLLDKEHILPVIFYDSKSIEDFEKPFYLTIVSSTQHFTKILIYPVLYDKILKIVIGGSKLKQKSVQKIMPFFSKVIHTSGIVYFKDNYIFEVYLAVESKKLRDLNEYNEKIKELQGVDFLDIEWISLIEDV